ncbi:hypothetical protein FACS1894153_3130 [Bacteroidia bacterium]|nr:hypothetical protein FACS1894153_3130 [Bacteroidia bacterium]
MLDTSDSKNIQNWFKDFLKWMETSKVGLDEKKSTNNHGNFYNVTRVAICLYTDQIDKAKKILNEDVSKKIFIQQNPDGSMKEELVRTLSLHYHTFCLEAITFTSIMADKIGINICKYKDAENHTIQKYIDFLLPYYNEEKTWEYQQIKPFDYVRAADLLKYFGKKLNVYEYMQVAQNIEQKYHEVNILTGQDDITK